LKIWKVHCLPVVNASLNQFPFVWQRDNGKCVNCQTNERLECDHIIPVVERGSDMERNVQLCANDAIERKAKRYN